MSRLFCVFFALLLPGPSVSCGLNGCIRDNKLVPIPYLNLTRAAGLWYEAGRTPNLFQAVCSSDMTYDYRLLPERKLEIVQSCRMSNGEKHERLRWARPHPGDSPPFSRLQVAAFRMFGFPVWLTYGEYWVVAVDPDYQWAVVGYFAWYRDMNYANWYGPEYGWILSRARDMDSALYKNITSKLKEDNLFHQFFWPTKHLYDVGTGPLPL